MRKAIIMLRCGWMTVLLVASMAAHAELVEGRDYRTLKPAHPTQDATKIEVLEYFSWGCSHCYELYPHLAQWSAQLPKDVAFLKSAVSVGFDQWVPLARAYFTFDYSGDIKRLDGLVFKAIHEQRVNLFSDENIAAWAEKQGVDRKKYLTAAKSMGVDAKVRQAEVDARSIPIDGTPTLIVDGKYVLVGGATKSYTDYPPLLNQLIAKARAEKQQNRK